MPKDAEPALHVQIPVHAVLSTVRLGGLRAAIADSRSARLPICRLGSPRLKGMRTQSTTAKIKAMPDCSDKRRVRTLCFGINGSTRARWEPRRPDPLNHDVALSSDQSCVCLDACDAMARANSSTSAAHGRVPHPSCVLSRDNAGRRRLIRGESSPLAFTSVAPFGEDVASRHSAESLKPMPSERCRAC